MKILNSYQNKIKKIAREFKEINPEKIILFGSIANGKVHRDSDIDICIIKKTRNKLKTKHQLRNIIWEKKIGFDPEIDIHVYPPKIYYEWLTHHDPFIEEIEKGKILYEKRPLR